MNIGTQFEATLAKSWVASGLNLLRLKITETGEERPCDERIDLDNLRLFNELKSVQGDTFNVRLIKQHQLKSLYVINNKFKDSLGLIFIEFRKHNIVKVIDILSLLNYIKINESMSFRYNSSLGYNLVKNNDIYLINNEFVKHLEHLSLGQKN